MLQNKYIHKAGNLQPVYNSSDAVSALLVWQYTVVEQLIQLSYGQYIPLKHDCETVIRDVIDSSQKILAPFPFSGNMQKVQNIIQTNSSNKKEETKKDI
ncbi:MAG: hypothetical protein HRT87_08185 [Legionellales bacterium]|nr:hypothetical protein [Legionellales bacterium]